MHKESVLMDKDNIFKEIDDLIIEFNKKHVEKQFEERI